MKKRMTYIRYSIGEGFRGVFTNGFMSMGAMLMLVCCLVIVGSIGLVIWNINAMIDDIGKQNEVAAFVDETLSKDETAAIGETLMRLEHVSSVVFHSKEEALREMKLELSEAGNIFDGLEDDNPLRDSYRVRIDDIKNAREVISGLENTAGIAKVRAHTDILETFVKLRNTVTAIGLTMIVILGIVAIFIISHSIRVSAFTRREEIAIMRMVGATKTFIHGSFLVEGLVIGIMGAAAAYLTQWVVYTYAMLPALEALPMVSFVPFSDVGLYIIALFAAAGMLMGLFGSALSIRKYLNA